MGTGLGQSVNERDPEREWESPPERKQMVNKRWSGRKERRIR
jgi:hypothetical protein